MTRYDRAVHAPRGTLELVLSLVNTHAHGERPDVLDDAALARAWLDGALRADVPVDRRTRQRLRELREALRLTLLAHAGLARAEEAAAALTPVCERSTLTVTIGPAGAPEVTGTGTGTDALVNDVLAAVAVASIDGSWSRMKACADPGCRSAFLDATKNGSTRYCATGGCASRARQRAFRARQQL